ncbi:MAG TPA: GNAT family N-acetyltransferase [Puia sp.]|nr:GNAT family N-acetyltransferase [Puia sp.]
MNIELRPWDRTDIPSLVLYANNRNVWNTLRNYFPHPYTQKDAIVWVRLQQDISPVTNFSIQLDGECVGGAGISLQSDIHVKNAEIGYWLGEPFWGRGVMTEAVRLLTKYAFEHFDLLRIYAEVFSNNPGSIKVLSKNGYQREAITLKSIFKNEQVIDGELWAIYRHDFEWS